MSILKAEDRGKWITAFIAIVCMIVGYLAIRLFGVVGEWVDLEAKIPHYIIWVQLVGVFVGVLALVIVMKNKNAMTYLNEVYGELVKVIWPDKDHVLKATVGIVIGISIVSGILVAIDMVCRKFLSLLY